MGRHGVVAWLRHTPTERPGAHRTGCQLRESVTRTFTRGVRPCRAVSRGV